MKIVFIVGARPQFVKLAPIAKYAKSIGEEVSIIHTGQHYDDEMSKVFFEELEIDVPITNLNIHSDSHGKQTAKMIIGIESYLKDKSIDWVLVFGDTNTTLAASIVVSKMSMKLAHIEAGLRSFNREMPEEVNRIVTDHLSDILFVPSEEGVRNLLKEGLENKMYHVDDIMTDIHFFAKKKISDFNLEKFEVDSSKYYLMTIHRPYNTDNPVFFDWLFTHLKKIDNKIIFPLHPRTKKVLENHSNIPNNIKFTTPLGFLDFQNLLSKSLGVITDSGGVQKEAYLWKVPCFTVRTETEWVETVDLGWNKLIIPFKDDLYKEIEIWKSPKKHLNIFGNGNASKKMIDIIRKES